MFLFIAALILLLVMGVWCSVWSGPKARLPIDWDSVQQGFLTWDQAQNQSSPLRFIDTTVVI